MSKQYPGGLITKTPVTPSGPYETSTASGIWTLDQQAAYAKQGLWPTAGNMQLTANYLVIAGGAGGKGGGGGAGGYRYGSSFVLGASFTVTVGAGGGSGGNGSNSVFSSITSAGGGTGGSGAGDYDGVAGGSGGGAYGYPSLVNNPGAGNTPSTSPSQGNDGGRGFSDNITFNNAGGGGGAGAVGGTATAPQGGNGGAGTASSITGTSVTRGGGGGGECQTGGGRVGGTGGAGGGGNGGERSTSSTAGTVNTGGGGGGGAGSAGGSGIVIISYPSTFPDLTSIDGGLVYAKTTSGGNTIYTFTAGTGTVTV